MFNPHWMLFAVKSDGFCQLNVTTLNASPPLTPFRFAMAPSGFNSSTSKLCVDDTGDDLDPFLAVTVHLYVPSSFGVITLLTDGSFTLYTLLLPDGSITFT